MIVFYFLVGIMPLSEHHIWGRFVGEFTVFSTSAQHAWFMPSFIWPPGGQSLPTSEPGKRAYSLFST